MLTIGKSPFTDPSSLFEAGRRVLREIILVEVGKEIDAGAVRAQQLREVLALTPWMMLGALLNCTILAAHFMLTADADPVAIAVWAALVWAFAIFTLAKCNAARQRPPRTTASKRAVIRAIWHATILGALWGSLPIIVLGVGTDMDRALVIITIVGMSASGSFVLAVLPAAALMHLTVMLLPTLTAMLFGLIPVPAALVVLILNYLVVLTIIILARYREFGSRLRDRHQLESQAAALAASMEEARRAANSADEANQAKSQFLAKMSHEIRTPMNGILGMAGLLERSGLTDRQRSLVATMNDSGNALLIIINDILDFSRIEAGLMKLTRRRFDLRGCIDGAVGLLAEAAQRKGLYLTTTFAKELPATVDGDDGRLRQILINLIGNAVKFTERGGISVDVALDDTRSGGHVVRCRVRDTGIGMTPRIRQLLFKPFEQGDGSITRKFGGTGLGLSITQSLVHAMGGTIDLDSEVGVGTTVTFTIVLGQAADDRLENELNPAASEPTPRGLEGLSVLVAEDNPVNQQVALAYLEALGCHVRVVEDGEQALVALRADSYDIVLMDCQMPQLDGLTATRTLRAIEVEKGLCRTPVVAVTANAYDSDRDDCLSAGMDDFLSKPYSEDDLAAILARWGRAGSRHSAAA